MIPFDQMEKVNCAKIEKHCVEIMIVICFILGIRRMFCAYGIATAMGKELELCEAFAKNTWGCAADVGTDVDLKGLCDEVKIPWDELKQKIAESTTSDFWGIVPEKNLELMQSFGFWGVPCILYDGVMVWGNDKLWVIEDMLHEELIGFSKSTSDDRGYGKVISQLRQILSVKVE